MHGWSATVAGNSLAAGQSGADELVGVGAVHLGAERAPGGAASLACDRQDPAGLVDGGVAVQQFAGAAVDVIGAAAAERVAGSLRCGGWCLRGQGKWAKAVLLSSCPCRRWWTSGGKPQPGG